ncbi:hypothetical protein [Cohnella soli]|uniref:NodB homology domain-containing protein n=1 Tax=Cohnella soli TaxID=425005 RepID=A0ABW0HP00_9BACL
MRMAKVGVWFDRASAEKHWAHGLNTFGAYTEEILKDYGIPFESLAEWPEADACSYDVIVAAHAPDDAGTASRLRSYAEAGGCVVSYGGLRCLARGLGFREGAPVSVGYATLPPSFEEGTPLRFLRAIPWLDGEGGEGPTLRSIQVGRGRMERWAIDVPYTVVGLQQGTEPVLRDGIPAPDGSADVDEGILKADDGIELDWELDRLRTEAGSPYFAYPYADMWKDAMVGHLVRCAYSQGLSLPFLGFWPASAEHIAMISHDSDLNEDEHAVSTLEALDECGIQSTWCLIDPGYSPDVHARVAQAGHELAFHYNALEEDGGEWSEEAFSRQLRAIVQVTGHPNIVSNKNHYTRLEGWGELFRWCERHSIRVDQTRGPSKRGNVGFPFGTCRPYRPVAWADEKNRIYDVLEIGFQTQDLDQGYWSDSSVVGPILERTRRAQGIAHFLFHQVHIHNLSSVRRAMSAFVDGARADGFVFWTSGQAWHWHEARRSAAIRGLSENGEPEITAKRPVEELVAWIPTTEDDPDVESRFGVPCVKRVFSVSVTEAGA